MDAKITELISLLSVDEDFELIQALCLKLSQILAEKEKSKDFENKYSAEKIKNSNEWKKLKHGIKILYFHNFLYTNKRYCKLRDKYNATGSMDSYIKKNYLEHKARNEADKFAEEMPDELVMTKYVLNKINRKLLNSKL